MPVTGLGQSEAKSRDFRVTHIDGRYPTLEPSRADSQDVYWKLDSGVELGLKPIHSNIWASQAAS